MRKEAVRVALEQRFAVVDGSGLWDGPCEYLLAFGDIASL